MENWFLEYDQNEILSIFEKNGYPVFITGSEHKKEFRPVNPNTSNKFLTNTSNRFFS